MELAMVKHFIIHNQAMEINLYNELKSILLEIKEDVSAIKAEKAKELLTPKEVCAELKISRDTYQRYVTQGIITQIAVGKGKRVKRSEIDRLIAEGTV